MAKTKKKKRTNRIENRGSEETFFQRGHTEGPRVHEKVLNVNNHQGKQVRTLMRYPLPLSEWLLLKRQEITAVGEDVEKREHVCSAGGI